MNLTKLMTEYYQLISKMYGEQEARSALAQLVNIAIYDIQQNGLEVTDYQLEKHIIEQIQDFLQISKGQVA